MASSSSSSGAVGHTPEPLIYESWGKLYIIYNILFFIKTKIDSITFISDTYPRPYIKTKIGSNLIIENIQ